MKAIDSIPPSEEPILEMIRGELSPTRRWTYRLFLVVVSVLVAALVALWATEPGPLPLRLHVAFAAMTIVGVGWMCVSTWILTRRACPTALDRLATTWMATAACALSLVVSVPIAVLRSGPLAAIGIGAVGATLLAVAVVLLRGAYSLRASLQAKLAELEKAA